MLRSRGFALVCGDPLFFANGLLDPPHIGLDLVMVFVVFFLCFVRSVPSSPSSAHLLIAPISSSPSSAHLLIAFISFLIRVFSSPLQFIPSASICLHLPIC